MVGARAILGHLPCEENHFRIQGIVGPSHRIIRRRSLGPQRQRALLWLGRRRQGDPVGCTVLVSPVGREGATSVALNLGAAAVRVGLHVVLVDANFDKPALSERFGLLGRLWVLDAFTGEKPIADCLVMSRMSLTHVLRALPIDGEPAFIRPLQGCLGESGSSGILVGESVLGAADTLELASVADLTLLIVRHGKSKYR